MRLLPRLLLLVLVAVIGWLAFAPVPIRPVAWDAPASTGYAGPYAPNTRLSGLTQTPLGGGRRGPEHLMARDGWVYAGLDDGSVVRLRADHPAQMETLLNTGGRPLGLDMDPQGRLLIADVMRGLLRATLVPGQPARIEVLLDRVDDGAATGDPVRYADGVAVGADGRIWLTDATRRFAARDWGGSFAASILDTLEHSCTGRLITLGPDGRAEVAVRDLCFPNGVTFTADGRELLLAETLTYRILRLRTDLRGASAPALLAAASAPGTQTPALRVLLDHLPGFPDNLTRGADGRVWVGLTKPRSAPIDRLSALPAMRSVTLRLPKALWPVPPAYGHLIAFDDDGRVRADLQDPAGTYPETTAATEAGGRLFVQSLNAPAVGWQTLSALGLDRAGGAGSVSASPRPAPAADPHPTPAR